MNKLIMMIMKKSKLINKILMMVIPVGMLVLSSCDGHKPTGILVDKHHKEKFVRLRYNPAIHCMTTTVIPEQFTFTIECDSCNKSHKFEVDGVTYEKYNVGDSIKL